MSSVEDEKQVKTLSLIGYLFQWNGICKTLKMGYLLMSHERSATTFFSPKLPGPLKSSINGGILPSLVTLIQSQWDLTFFLAPKRSNKRLVEQVYGRKPYQKHLRLL
jgi:hypothetical protein